MRKNTEISSEQFKEIINNFYNYFENGYVFEDFLKPDAVLTNRRLKSVKKLTYSCTEYLLRSAIRHTCLTINQFRRIHW